MKAETKDIKRIIKEAFETEVNKEEVLVDDLVTSSREIEKFYSNILGSYKYGDIVSLDEIEDYVKSHNEEAAMLIVKLIGYKLITDGTILSTMNLIRDLTKEGEGEGIDKQLQFNESLLSK